MSALKFHHLQGQPPWKKKTHKKLGVKSSYRKVILVFFICAATFISFVCFYERTLQSDVSKVRKSLSRSLFNLKEPKKGSGFNLFNIQSDLLNKFPNPRVQCVAKHGFISWRFKRCYFSQFHDGDAKRNFSEQLQLCETHDSAMFSPRCVFSPFLSLKLQFLLVTKSANRTSRKVLFRNL